jgi:hypothetical protein
MPRRRPVDPAPGSQQYEIAAQARAGSWRECCQSSDDHRFDCREAPRHKRGAGPFGPVAPATPRELVQQLATEVA